MKVIDKRPTAKTTDFDALSIGAVFEFAPESDTAGYFGACMKINDTDCEHNAIDLTDCSVFTMPPCEKVCELNAYLVIEEEQEQE